MVEQVGSYAAIFNALLSIGLVALLVNLAGLARQAERSRADVIEERYKNAAADLDRAEKRAKEDREELSAKNEELRLQLQEALSNSGITVNRLVTGNVPISKSRIAEKLISEILSEIESSEIQEADVDPRLNLEVAKAYASQGSWKQAASLLDEYTSQFPSDFEVQFLRGVSQSNARDSNITALRSYNEAIALINDKISLSLKARVFTYRGAILKRLRRLPEALADIRIALELAEPGSYEQADAHYNLSSILALMHDREGMLSALRVLVRDEKFGAMYRTHIQSNIHAYFDAYQRDQEFMNLIFALPEA
jgi:tetratricopeptide (TPR) repeat protein